MADDLSSKLFDAAEAYTNVETFAASSKEVNSGARRLEGAFYGSGGYRALKTMTRAGFRITTIGNLADVTWIGPFKRTWVDDPSAGVPFHSSSTMLMAQPEPSGFISRALTPNLNSLIIKEGTILVSCSGTIGNMAIATSDLAGAALSQDAMRIAVRDQLNQGLTYAFLLSDAGQFLVKRNKSGSVVEHIYGADVSSLPLPLLPKALRQEMTQLVNEACALRAKANQSLREAEEAVWRQNYLDPKVKLESSSDLETITISSASLLTEYEGNARIRLEATFQAKAARTAERLVQSAREWKRLRKIVAAIPYTGPGSMPGVPKVEEGNGIPTVTGRDLGLARPRPSYHLARTNQKVLDKMIPARGTTLVMCAGTLGKTDYVRGNYEEWAVSLDVIRVVPAPLKLHPGYVHAFLTSPLGQAQMLRHKYGSVIPRIHSRQVAEVCVPMPPDKGASVGAEVDQAYDMRATAVSLENQAISLFTSAIQRGRDYIESEWGSEY